ncbi:questin oxidase family protein [Falsiroseomonas selenitidurans]|uniref:Questin oxidase family protein n=1 Tax=Falsiroseomonas selenitidurans TaxID=2716335 RepID=A0ABX1E669_9PROT|nr:questin oxidase family protein [Falsiroseomonas selenitidurans]NKC32671.1 questin oxidase family protein [Falsiroseomonas selenitidurans]
MTDSVAPAAEDALTEARRLSAEYGTAFANHTAMVLWAMRDLGGTEAQARRFLAHYIRDNGLGSMAPADGWIDRNDWTARLGDRRAEAAYRAFFRLELGRLGSPRALQRQYLPRLLPGIAASALHALMRLAYAVDSGTPSEVAAALGYWAATYLPLGEGIGAAAVTDQPAGVLLAVAAKPALRAMEFDDGLLWHAMRRTAAMPDFAAVHDWLAVQPDSIARMARDSLLLFGATLDFCALHALTGTHWLRLVLPALDPADQSRAIRFFWQAIASVYPKMGCPPPLTAEAAARMRALPAPDWPAIAAAACRSDDEHDISLTWSCRCEEAQWGDRLYRVLAARRLGLA